MPSTDQGSRPSFFASSVPMGTEDGRATLQSRLALFTLLGVIFSLAFLVVLHAAGVLVRRDYSPRLWLAPQTLDLLGIATINGVLWLAYRGRPRSAGFLAVMDVTGILLIASLACLPLALPASGAHPGHVIFVVTTMVIARAAIVPTPASWTLGVSALAMLPALVFIEAFHAGEQAAGWTIVITAPLECGVAVALATVISSVIYGLRRRVQEARQLGQYTLEEKLGHGGMGEVYRAKHAMLRRPTAVKLLPPGATGAATLARFEREVQLTSLLTHPNTISVFDYGRTADGTFYYAMEYLDGFDLDRLVRADGPQPPGRVVHIVRQVCGSLAEAHGVGLIHRDVKPANVMLCERGGTPDVAKVLDFGLVREVVQAGDSALTHEDLVVGTPLFLSPEALTAPDEMDARSDLYALGCVAYYLLTGAHTFEGRTPVEVCAQHLHVKPVPLAQRLGYAVPADLEALVLRCLEKDPAHRPQSARELDMLLTTCRDVEAWTDASAREWWRERRPRLSKTDGTQASGLSQLLTIDWRGRRAV